jgi:hypothetical protein
MERSDRTSVETLRTRSMTFRTSDTYISSISTHIYQEYCNLFNYSLL